jgi:integral membrane protein
VSPTYPTNLAKPEQIRSALAIYRVLAIIAGIALFVLILEMVMKYGFHQENVLTKYWSPIHGLNYMAYAASVANLGIKAAWGIKRIVLNLLAGFVPVVPWVAEQRNSREVHAMLSRAYLAGDGGSGDSASAAGGPAPSGPGASA